MSRSRSLAAALLILVCAQAHAADFTPTRAFRTFSKSAWRGLPQSSVMALAQDKEGVLWLGTLDGTATFDGKTITPVAAVPGAPLRGVITAIVARKAGGVYVASQAGVHLYDGSAWHLIPTKRAVVSLAESRDGVLWIADGDGAIWTLRGASDWQLHDDVRVPAVAIAASPDGSMWAATATGAVHIVNGQIEPVAGGPLPGRPGAILVAHDGIIWTATQACTVHWTRGGADGWHQAPFAPWPRGAFRCLVEDRRGRIWAGSYGGRVALGNATTPWQVWGVAEGPFEAGVMSILADREGSIWYGLNAVGVTQWVGESWSHLPMVDPSNPGRALFSAFGLARTPQPGGLLVATFNTGALRLDPSGSVRHFTAADGLTEDVRSIVEPEPNTFFAGTRFGIFESKNGQPFHQVVKLPSGFTMGFFKSPDGRWYAATSTQGVYVRENETWTPVAAINNALDDKSVRCMMWRRNGELWVATLRGITVFREGMTPIRLSAKNQVAMPESVNAVLEVSDDEVWAGGTGGVAVRRGAQWTLMTEANGVPGQTVYSLARGRDGAIWAGGSAGVGRYKDGHWSVWDSRSGLLQEECNLNGLIVDDDAVYVGTMSGLAHFDPSVKPLPVPPLTMQWRTTPPRDATGIAQLARGDRALHLRWVAPWLDPHPVQYRVRVPRLHNNWSPSATDWSAPTSEDHLDIENLAAGLWHVDVQARVEGHPDWSAPLSLDVHVPPFWYETIPARLAMLALLALAIYAAVRLRLRALRKHAAQLEQTVHERTAELAEKVEQLKDSEQRALAASRAKSTFLASMSHELRTPLNGVLGFAQLLSRRKNRDEQDRHGLDVIMKSGEHLLSLINNVLSLSKIEAGRITLEETEFDLRNIVTDVEHLLRLRSEEKSVKFITQVDEAHLPRAVKGDEMRLRQILLNLVGNAVKFTERGSVTLRVAWSDGRARFEVEDTGPGIASDELPRLFEPFAQTETGQRAREGTGLGLALSRELARLMNGDITAESVVGRGSIFRVDVSLPAAEQSTRALDDRRVARVKSQFEGTRILVVDDTAINRHVLRELLTSVGFDVREAASGEQAIDAWRDWHPQLIWMDKRMQGLDGLEATRMIREEEKTSGRAHVPILALSASALDHERGEILAAGCDDFVAKPFRESMIFAKLHEHIGVDYEYEERTPLVPDAAKPLLASVPAGSASVLLVDDDWICRQVATELLHASGIGVTAASSGREALELIGKSQFDLIFMDLHMPDMGGVETARRIRAMEGVNRLPLIAMSADTFDGEAARLKDTGLDDYIGKPIEPAALAEILGKWLPHAGATERPRP